MKVKILSIGLLFLAMGTISTTVSSDSSKPSCDEEPTRRDCVKVEDPNATPPPPNVNRVKKPAPPIARPLPASGGAKAR